MKQRSLYLSLAIMALIGHVNAQDDTVIEETGTSDLQTENENNTSDTAVDEDGTETQPQEEEDATKPS